MAMIRIKRRVAEDPVDAVFLAIKRVKTDNDVESYIFKYAETVSPAQDEGVINKESLPARQYRSNPVTASRISSKLREENRLNSANSRWKVVSRMRHIDEERDDEEDHIKTIVLNLEPNLDTNEAAAPMDQVQKDNDECEWMYDYYYTSSLDVCDSAFDNILSALPVDSELVFDFEERRSGDEQDDDDDEDSNSEGHWKNQYPEDPDSNSESADSCENEDNGSREEISDQIVLFRGIDLGSDCNLSSSSSCYDPFNYDSDRPSKYATYYSSSSADGQSHSSEGY